MNAVNDSREINKGLPPSEAYEATFLCIKCGASVTLRASPGQWASSVLSHWQTECGSLCKDCLYKERQNDMNYLGPLIAALIMVESSGKDAAIGADGKSFGPLQITDICREDVNRIAGTCYTRSDCFDRAASSAMFALYIAHYCTANRLGRAPTWQDAARIWNGGPDGWRQPCTLNYWRKVETELERRR